MPITARLLGPGEEAVLRHVAADVFDGPVDPRWSSSRTTPATAPRTL